MRSNVRLPPAVSVTHAHLLACINTSIRDCFAREPDVPVRILDAGCGDGRLMSYLCGCLALLQPSRTIEIFGFDVIDHGIQSKAFLERATASLREEFPDVDWSQRIFAATVTDPWPFAAESFDVVVSNQVMEHVGNPERFLGENYRVLRPDGRAYHLFPLKHYIYEGHLLLPWVHRLRSWELMRAYIARLSSLGLGKYRLHKRLSGVSRQEFAERHADYVYFWTHYLTEGEIARISRQCGFRTCFRYTKEFYSAKLRSVLRLTQKVEYPSANRPLRDALWVKALRYASSVTLTLHKRNAY